MTSKHSPSLNLKTQVLCPMNQRLSYLNEARATQRLFWIVCVRLHGFAQLLLRTGRTTFTQQGHIHDIMSDRSVLTAARNTEKSSDISPSSYGRKAEGSVNTGNMVRKRRSTRHPPATMAVYPGTWMHWSGKIMQKAVYPWFVWINSCSALVFLNDL